MTKIELLNKLKIFVKKIIQKLEKLMKDGEIFNNITEIIIPNVKNLSFNKQTLHYNTTITTKNVEIPNYKKYLEFINDFCKKLPEFNELSLDMREVYQKEEDYINIILDNFLFNLISKTQKGITKGVIEKEIGNLINDLEMKSIKWKVKVWIYCIWVEDEEYHFTEDLILRRISPQEIEFTLKNEPFPRFGHLDAGVPTSSHVIELNIEINLENMDKDNRFSNINLPHKINIFSQRCIEEEIEIILLTFRLYKLGAVFPSKYEISTESYNHSGLLKGFYKEKIKNIYEYGVVKSDIQFLREIYNFIGKSELRKKILAQKVNQIICPLLFKDIIMLF